MRIAVVYDKNDYKLTDKSYSKNYRDMLEALCKDAQRVTESCKVDADVVIYFDPHSSHNIEVEGGKLIYEYYNDPHQKDFTGVYKDTKQKVVKLGARNRSLRSIKRKVDFIICPSIHGYNKYIRQYLGNRLVWFPVAPAVPDLKIPPLSERDGDVLANGHTWRGNGVFNPYTFRTWAHSRDVTVIPHYGENKSAPTGEQYMRMLTKHAGGLAACDVYVVAKYLEIPLAGCVCFAQYLPEYEMMGFKHGVNCVYVNEQNFDLMINKFKKNVKQYQEIADAGHKTALRWTADVFAGYIKKHAEKYL